MLNTILLQAAAGGGASGLSSILMIVLIFAIFYFFMIAPQQKKQKKINAFRDSLRKGDKVVTIGGIHGRVSDIKDNTIILEVTDGVRITFDKSAIAGSDVNEVNTK